MCLSPIRIKNPNFGLSRLGLNFFKDCSSAYINIPCGHCESCISRKQTDLVQRILMESRKSRLFFAMLSYNSDSLPHIQVNGYNIAYADVKDLQNTMKRLRKVLTFPFRYFAVCERGSQRGRPHFHVIFIVSKEYAPNYDDCIDMERTLYSALLKEWRRNYGSHKKPLYRPLLTYKRKYRNGHFETNYDLHYINPCLTSKGVSSPAFYCLKYMLKTSDRESRLQRALQLNCSKSDYEKVWKIVRSRYFKSLDFGLSKDPEVKDYLRKGVKLGIRAFEYPVFINPDSGQTFPLARFYKSKGDIFTLEDMYSFYWKKDTDRLDNVFIDEVDGRANVQRMNRFDKKKRIVDSHSYDVELSQFDNDCKEYITDVINSSFVDDVHDDFPVNHEFSDYSFDYINGVGFHQLKLFNS